MFKINTFKYYIFEYILLFIILFNIVVFNSYIIPIFISVLYIIIHLIIKFIYKDRKKVYSYFNAYNTFVSGFKRTGKDLTIQNYIHLKFGTSYDKKVKWFTKLIKKNRYDLIHKYLSKIYSKYDLSYKNKKTKTLEQYIKSYYYANPNYLSTISYGYGCRLVSVNEFRLFKDAEYKQEITHHDFVMGSDIFQKKNKSFEGKMLIIPEAQIYFPASMYQALVKKYPSFPIFVATSGHSYDMNIIVNSQVMGHVWDKIRDQSDIYIRAIKTFPKKDTFIKKYHDYIPFIRRKLFTTLIIYDKYESAEKQVLPFNPKLGIKDRSLIKAEKEKYRVENGSIKLLRTYINKEYIQYDTRHFHDVIFGYKYTDKD